MRVFMVEYGAYVIEAPNKEVYVYDCGTSRVGRHFLVAFIKSYLNKDRIKKVFISHYHFNHFHGLAPLIEAFKGNIDDVYTGGVYSNDQGGNYLLGDPLAKEEVYAKIEQYNIPLHYTQHGQVFEEDGMRTEIWSPLSQHADHGGYTDYPNDATNQVVKFIHGDFSYLATGDMFEPEDLLEMYDKIKNGSPFDLSATVYSVPHHGDMRSMRDDCVDPLGLQAAILETHHSSYESVEFLNGKGIQTFHLSDGRKGIKGEVDGSFTSFDIPKEIAYGRGAAIL